jgi:hypothetical protein
MAGYRGDGYGVYGDHGGDDFRFGDDRGGRDEDGGMFRGERGPDRSRGFDRDDGPRQGAAHGNVMGRAERAVRSYVEGGDHDSGRGHQLSDDPRAVGAADDWNRRFGREGHEGSYAQQQDPYHSYRERHLQEMDRDYQDWCREREQQFHNDFSSWRSGRLQQPGQEDEMPALELSDAAHATSPSTPISLDEPAPAGSPGSRRRGSSGSTRGGTEDPTGEQRDR